MNILVNNRPMKVNTIEEVVSSTYTSFRVFKVNINDVAFAAVLEDGTSAILLGNLYYELSDKEKAFVFLHELGHIRAGHHKEAAYGEYEWDITHEYIADRYAATNMKEDAESAFCSAMDKLAVLMDIQHGDAVIEDVNMRYKELIA